MASRTDAGIFTEMFFLLIADISLQNELLGERPIDSLPLESNSQISDPAHAVIDKVINNEFQLQTLDETELELTRQDEYLAIYGLYRQPIVGDGNCLFRSVSFSLYGNQDHHQELRNLAIQEIEQNLDIFRLYFFNPNGVPMNDLEIQQELRNLRQLGTFAGQESIFALSRYFGVNILVTVGGDLDHPEVATLEHDFGNSNSRIHLIWTRPGGGHYESVTETVPVNRRISQPHSVGIKSKYHWNLEYAACKKIDLDSLVSSKDTNNQEINYFSENPHLKTPTNYFQTIHSYGKSSNDLQKTSSLEKNQCSICKKTFHDKANLNRHKKNVHDKENDKRMSCIVPSCDVNFFHVEDLVNHLISIHDSDIRIENLNFDNINSFEKFLAEESLKRNTRYILHRPKTLNKDGSQRYTLVCHRDGKKRTCDSKDRKRREYKKGSCKLDGLCLSRFSVLVAKDGTVKAKYIQSHTHSTNFEESKYLPIPDHIKSEIKTMLALKIPINTILDKVREKFSDRNNRDDLTDLKHYHLIDRKTIHNLKKKIIDSSVIRHSDDATSTFLRVDALKKEKFNPILIYKQQNVDDSELGLNKEDFMLAIMTKQQLKMYEKFAPLILCMDSTHKTNMYSFKLITLLVPDEFRHGYPVAFCISSKENEQAISLFLSAVKNKSPQTTVNILMTDDDNAGWNAAKKVFGPDLQHFLCIWHIHKNWRLKIQQHIKDKEQQAEIYCLLCAAMDAKSESVYNKYSDVLIQRLSDINPALLKYVNDFYLSRKEKWAMCFRNCEYAKVNTNMFLESFHNQLKTVYFEGKRNRRIDVLLETLLQIENNLYFKHLASQKFSMPSQENIKTSDRHQSSFDICDSAICQVNEDTFSLASQNNLYTIIVKAQKCPETHCYTKCKKVPCLDLCRHILTCNCHDFEEGNICKHMHKVMSLLNKDTLTTPLDKKFEFVEKNKDKVIGTPLKKRRISEISNDAKIQGIQERMDKIMSQIKNGPLVQQHRLNNIISALDCIISANDGCENLPNSLEEFTQTEKIASNANNVLQPRFRPTTKNPGRKRKDPLRKPSQQEKDNVLERLQQHNQQGQNSAPSDEIGQDQRSGPSVAPYPPLRLVHTNEPPVLPSQTQDPVINLNDPQGLPSWYRIPPSLYGRRITVVRSDGKKQSIIFTGGQHHTNEDKDN
ncbi:uncharacterized protein LOC134261354 isoform X2 [Saccostrea cucullata]|uniref:uncharacterized protein LOC134261354 isoform X2 n=1 Tax=Saccostrea cuccullata TaxID=36930 RepID=UPI002ED68E2B